jgi:hypothetical protein
MKKRPLSLSIIGWFLIVTGVLGLFGMLFTMNNPMTLRIYAQSPLPLPVHLAIGAVGTTISAISGYGILKGFNWSRFLYVGWSLIGFAISIATIPVTTIIGLSLIFFAVIVFFLFRPAANAWFSAARPAGA